MSLIEPQNSLINLPLHAYHILLARLLLLHHNLLLPSHHYAPPPPRRAPVTSISYTSHTTSKPVT